ncbi:MAG: efflux RND transporter permease subunit [Chloroflexota bacterium]
MKIWEIAIKQPVFMTMVLLAGVVLGLYSYFRIPVDLFPDISFPVIVVNTPYPGANPDEVEETITQVLEEELSSLSGLDDITSTTLEGLSSIQLTFTFETDVNDAAQRVQEKINAVTNRLPADALDSTVQRFDPSAAPIMTFGVADSSGERSPSELRTWVEDSIQAPLQQSDGVASVEVLGGEVREIKVLLDLKAMEARRLTPNQVIAALQGENLNIPGGSLESDSQSIPLRTPGNFEYPEDLESVVVRYDDTAPVYLRDVATVVDGFKDRNVITRVNGDESVTVVIRRQSGTNTVQVADGVKKVMERIEADNPDMAITVASDQSIDVRNSTNGALFDLLMGMGLAALTVFFFFMNIRNTLLTVIGLPIIMITTIFFMSTFGLTLNLITLLALALVTGLVIDDGIVVRENIIRYIDAGYSGFEAASRATAQVILPVIATTAAILAVFVPIGFASGIAGQFFSAFGLTVSIAVVVSTIEALTLAPMMGARFFRPNRKLKEGESRIENDGTIAEEKAGTGLLDRIYGGMIGWSLGHRWLTLLFAVVVVGITVYFARGLETAFAPNLDEGEFNASIELPPSTPLSVTEGEALAIENVFLSHPDVEAVFTTIGSTSSTELAEFTVKVKDGASAFAVLDRMRVALADAPGITFTKPEGGPGGSDPLVGNKDVAVQLTGRNASYTEIGEASLMVMEQLNSIEGFVDVESSYEAGNPEVQIQVDRERAAEFGLSTAQVGSYVRTLINGQDTTTFRGEGEEAEIVVRLKPEDRTDVEDVLALNVLSPRGQLIPLSIIATADVTTGPSQIQRLDRQPTVGIGGNAQGRSIPSVRDDVLAMVDSIQLPEGITIKQGGEAEDQAESFISLFQALGLSVIFIYMVLASQFGSFVQPLLVMLALPLSLNGAALGLVLVGRPFDITAFIGLILLMGLAVKNSILLVDFANQEHKKGASATEAMLSAGKTRLRPILMTAISLILAMVPVALAVNEGGEFRQSMGVVIMGGMVTSTLLTLFVVPVAYSFVVGAQDWWAARRKRKQEEGKETEREVPRVAPELELVATSAQAAYTLTEGGSNADPNQAVQPAGDD